MRLEFVRVSVEAFQRAEEDLPLHPEITRDLDDLRHLLQLLPESRGRKHCFKLGSFGERRAERSGIAMLLASVPSAACASETPLSSVSRLSSALKRACDAARGIESGQLQGSARRQSDRRGRGSGAQLRISGNREKHGKLRRIEAVRRDVIRRASGPSRWAVALRDRRLPLLLLIGVGKKVQRQGCLLGLILGARERLHQGSDICHHREFFGGEQARQFRQLAMKRVRRATGINVGVSSAEVSARPSRIEVYALKFVSSVGMMVLLESLPPNRKMQTRAR